MEIEEDLDTLLLGEEEGIDRRPSMPERQPLSHFGPRQGNENNVSYFNYRLTIIIVKL